MTPIALRNLSKHFGEVVAVDSVHLDIEAGHLFFLLGPSGCGKTTLLRMLAGFTEPTTGNIRFGDKDITRQPPNKRETAMVFQGYALWPHMNVAQNVGFGLNVRHVKSDEKRKRVDEALDMVQMRGYAKRRPNELSGGQQQRVALARALVVKPRVLLMDEPLSNLDAKLRLEMRSQIRELVKQTGITAVYVTHDQKEALSMADHIAVMEEGRVVQIGAPHELYSRPVNQFVADFLGETNFIPAEVVAHEGGQLVLRCSAGTIRSEAFPDLVQSGNQVVCSVRPESIRLRASAETNGSNCLPVERADLVYLGEVAQHYLRAKGPMTLKSLELNPSVQPGDESAYAVFDPRDVVVLKH